MKTLTLLVLVTTSAWNSCVVGYSDSTRTVTINFNTLLDTVLESVQENASVYNLDPFKMETVTETVNVAFITGNLTLKNGRIYGANTVFRYADAIAQVDDDKIATASLQIGVRNLTYTADYSLDVSFIHAKGKAHGAVTNIFADLVLLADVKDTSDVTATVKSLDISSVGDITAHLQTNNTVSQVMENAVVDVILALFKKRVVHVIQTDLAAALNDTVVGMHFNMGG